VSVKQYYYIQAEGDNLAALKTAINHALIQARDSGRPIYLVLPNISLFSGTLIQAALKLFGVKPVKAIKGSKTMINGQVINFISINERLDMSGKILVGVISGEATLKFIDKHLANKNTTAIAVLHNKAEEFKSFHRFEDSWIKEHSAIQL
jgi:hypothetical protein